MLIIVYSFLTKIFPAFVIEVPAKTSENLVQMHGLEKVANIFLISAEISENGIYTKT